MFLGGLRFDRSVRPTQRFNAMSKVMKPSEVAIELWGHPITQAKRQRIYRWIKEGVFKNVLTVGKSKWIPRSEVQALVNQSEDNIERF